MKVLFTVFTCIVFASSYIMAAEDAVLKNQKDRISYAIGVDIGNSLRKNLVEVNTDIMVKGLRASLAGKKTLMTDQEVRDTIAAYQQELQAKQMEQLKIDAQKNKKEGEAFLAKNKKNKDVISLPSGLQYSIISKGSGTRRPKAADMATVHYRGMLLDGTEFDSSYKRNAPATFAVSAIIKGWTEALLLMEEGAKWKLFIPPDLGYGEMGRPPTIPPNATLIFETELVKVIPVEAEAPLEEAK